MGLPEGALTMSSAVAGLEPALVWKYFAEIARIPRCSKHEERMTRYVLDTAGRLGLEATADGAGNVVVRKPAAAGRERVPMVCLQGHLDMVCEKNKEVVHDFAKDPIELVRTGDVIMANGTTLGADNGIAVATSLAIMEDRTLEHGPLEFLFTVDEETGLTGAQSLQRDFLRSRILLNLDSEEEGELYVGCSGGRDTTAHWTLATDPAPAQAVAGVLAVSGLRGGHSGMEIHQGRGNAIKTLNRALLLLDGLGARIAGLQGGSKRNAIPREAEATAWIPARRWDEAVQAVSRFAAEARAEVSTVDPGLTISLTALKGARRGRVLKRALQRRILRTISGLPHGVIKMSADIPGLVETSTNVAVLETGKRDVTLATSQRSSVASEINEICDGVRAIMELGGAAVTQGDGYPGWKPNLDSPILALAKRTYRELYGKEPAVKAIHAGLECGIIGERQPGMDMLSFGPTMTGVHSPDEKLYIETVPRFWAFLMAILRNVN
jgi:dipeptidase D